MELREIRVFSRGPILIRSKIENYKYLKNPMDAELS